MDLLPQCNRDLIYELMKVLWAVDQNSYVNQMDASTLGLLIGPLLLSKLQSTVSKRKIDQEAIASETKQVTHLVKFMISEYEYVFKVHSFLLVNLFNNFIGSNCT